VSSKKDLTKKLNRLYSEAGVLPKKYAGEQGKTIIVLPSPVQKKDFTDYQYGLNVDEKVIKMASKLAERMAVAMVRESLHMNLDSIVDKICDKVVPDVADRIGEYMNSTFPDRIAEGYLSTAKEEIKREIKEFVFEKPELNIDRSEGIEIKGDIGKKITSEENTDKDLDLLDSLL